MTFRIILQSCFLLLGIWFPLSGLAQDTTTPPSTDCSRQQFQDALAARESGGNYAIQNSFGYAGRYQHGESYVATAGVYSGDSNMNQRNQDWSGTFNIPGFPQVTTIQDYLNTPAAQDWVQDRMLTVNQQTIQNGGLNQYIGQTINGVTITESGLAAACHLRGCAGTLNCLQGSGPCTDGYGTSVFEYMNRFGGYDLDNSGDGSCSPSSNTSSPRSATAGNPLCAEDIRSRVSEQVNSALTKKMDFIQTYYTAPAPLGQMANAPCMSKELQRISNQFSYSISRYSPTTGLSAVGLTGPIAGLMGKFIQSEYNSQNAAAATNPSSLNFQTMASSAMGDLLSSLGLGDAFSGALCGLMIDMVIKYIQCENPIQFPSLGNMFGSLNNLLPSGCAGAALASTVMQAANSKTLQTVNQPITFSTNSSGTTTYTPGSATNHNLLLGLQ